jgi:hypothetical protein
MYPLASDQGDPLHVEVTNDVVNIEAAEVLGTVSAAHPPWPLATPVGAQVSASPTSVTETGHIPGTWCRHLPRNDENHRERNRRSRLV